jgi:hypothetical protein
MSIYRKFDSESHIDVYAKPLKRAAENPTSAPRGDAAPAPSAMLARRRGEPADEPLAWTVEWAAKLPPDIRPMNLVRQFPRIGNFLAATWTSPDTLRPYLDELFVDRRGNRKGFPPDVMEELFALRNYYEELYPATGKRWDDSMRHR